MNPLSIFKPTVKTIQKVENIFEGNHSFCFAAFDDNTDVYLSIFDEYDDGEQAIAIVFKNKKQSGYCGTLKETMKWIAEKIYQ